MKLLKIILRVFKIDSLAEINSIYLECRIKDRGGSVRWFILTLKAKEGIES